MNGRKATYGALFLLALCASVLGRRIAMATEPPQPQDPSKRTSATGGDPSAGKQIFLANCAVCHGAGGRGDGPGAAGLNPKPADFCDRARMAGITEDVRVKAVTNGGASVGASAAMPPFGEVLTARQIKDVLAYIRSEFTH